MRLGWTVAHSQSGFNAVRTHLLGLRGSRASLYAKSIGPLLTPRRVIEALLAGEIDIGPLDSYFYDLLLAAEPETAARLRIIETTALAADAPACGLAWRRRFDCRGAEGCSPGRCQG